MKLRLNLDSLRVETFVADPEATPRRGTVHAQEDETERHCPLSWPWTGCTGCTCDEVCVTPAWG
jgi:hypothetical protein